jgi:hypothetical protein
VCSFNICPSFYGTYSASDNRAIMTLTRGPTALFPCPSCTVPFSALHDLSRTYPMRTADGSRAVLEASRCLRKTKANAFLRANGLHAVEVHEIKDISSSLIALTYCCHYRMPSGHLAQCLTRIKRLLLTSSTLSQAVSLGNMSGHWYVP